MENPDKVEDPPGVQKMKQSLEDPQEFDGEVSEDEVPEPDTIQEMEQRIMENQVRGAGGPPSPGGQPPGRAMNSPGPKDFVSPISYILEPYIPKEYEQWFRHFKIMVSNVLPNANIRRQDIPRYLDYFDALWEWLKVRGIKIPSEARLSFRLTMELQLTRAVEALERKIQKTNRSVSETNVPEGDQEQGSWWNPL